MFMALCLCDVEYNAPEVQKKLPEVDMDFMEICHYYNYQVEQHFVETDDGYILTYK